MDVYAGWFAAGASLVAVGILFVLLRKLAAYRTSTIEPAIRQGFSESRTETSQASRDLREEVAGQLKSATDTLVKTIGELGTTQSTQLEAAGTRIKELTDSNMQALREVRQLLDDRLNALRKSNEEKLDEMRKTVDEKLQTALEKRLTESFRVVSENLEAVQRGLGEMKSLAVGVGDLKRALTNVKTRGTWGEVQLGALLEDILTPDQYARNVQTKDGSREVVEYAIRLPGKTTGAEGEVLLPIDAKFPQEDYLRVLDASGEGDAEKLKKAEEALSRSIILSAREIRDKHVNPPKTTDFAIMFLPTEGLYAEFLRRPGQIEELQRTCHVVVAGPTTLSALLTSLRVGFETLAIERRSSEVQRTLSAVKTEFGKFGETLAKVKKQLESAASAIDRTGVRTRAMERALRSVEPLSSDEAVAVLGAGSLEAADVDIPGDPELEEARDEERG